MVCERFFGPSVAGFTIATLPQNNSIVAFFSNIHFYQHSLKGVLINPECIDICHCEERSDVAISLVILEVTAEIPTVVLALGGTPSE